MDMAKPKIRFKGYTDEWEQRKLGEFAEKTFGGGTPKTSNESFWKGNIPWIQSSDLIEGSLFDVEPRKYISQEAVDKSATKLVPENSVAIVTRVGVGKLAFMPFSYATSQDFLSLSVLKTEPQFTVYALYKKLQLELNTVQGTSIKGVTKDELLTKEIMIPCYEEQEKIGSYLHSLDHLITLHQRKCEQAKKLKKYMLQKMFPQNGQKVPEIRFKGFTDDWEQRKFSDCYKMSSGYAFKMSDYCDEGVGLINGESIQHGIINDDNLNHLPESFVQHYPDFLLKENDIVVGLNRPITNGNLKIARIPSKYNDSLLYQRAGKIVYKTDCDKDFTYVLLSQEILKHTLVEAVGSDQPFISTSKLDGWKMMMPSDIEEQVKIGEYFQKLDYLITLHQQKCDELKNIKKFMLQNMFM